ncbi:MAG: spore germination protein [Alicyclobacillus sp.]|nr:spore germination protein [Alicyclobacillus sp.]
MPTRVKEVQERLKETFHLPVNKDVVVREFSVGPDQWPAVAVFIDGMASTLIVNESILEPLMVLTADDLFGSQAAVDGAAQARAGAAPPAQGRESFGRPAQFGDKPPLRPLPDRMDRVVQTLLPSNQVSVVDTWSGAVDGILTGSTAVFVEGTERAVIAESKGWEHRSVSLPQTESVVKGPHQAFTESFRANTALIRALLRSADLVTEMMSVGRLGKTDVAIMYMHGLTNERLVAEVKRRIEAVDVDYLADSGTLQQFIEDDPRVWLPQSLSTERPDRVAQMLTEGYVAILVGQSTFVLVVPVVFWTLMQSAEDAYVRYPFGSFLRGIRWVALAAALLVPSLYLAVTNYHPEMIPTDLMMAIAGSREQVPFPAIVEILIMEFAIELIREAGIRIPSIIGPTIGIVGALIIGQAAVQAGIVSPLLVIVIAVTALASFSIPTYNLQFGVRIMRFVFLLVAAMFGFYGLALAIVAMIARLSVQKSFGVPLFAPVAPKMDSAPDVFARGPAYAMNQRPLFLYTQKSWRQQPYTRPWSALSARRQNTIRTREQRQDSNSFSPPGRAGRNGGGNNGGRSSE